MSERAASIVGVDVGGTKTHLAVVDANGQRNDTIAPSSDWRHGPLFSDAANFERLAAWIQRYGEFDRGTSIVLGIRDCDTPAQLAFAGDALRTALGDGVAVLNDADLLGPAAGLGESITMVVGTGSIISGKDVLGNRITVDGHGWLFGDWGSGPGLVREAIGRLLDEWDRGAPGDLLAGLLCTHFGVPDLQTLGSIATVTADPDTWGSASLVIFDAVHRGSAVAEAVIGEAADRLAAGVAAVHARGAIGDVVVAAGGVITAQPPLAEAVRSRLRTVAPSVRLLILANPPVDGALQLARRAAREPDRQTRILEGD